VTNNVAPGAQLVGSLIPYADFVTNTSTLNLTVAPATTLQTWNVGSQSFTLYKFSAGAWKIGTLASVPQLSVAQGIFLTPPTLTNVWVETLP